MAYASSTMQRAERLRVQSNVCSCSWRLCFPDRVFRTRHSSSMDTAGSLLAQGSAKASTGVPSTHSTVEPGWMRPPTHTWPLFVAPSRKSSALSNSLGATKLARSASALTARQAARAATKFVFVSTKKYDTKRACVTDELDEVDELVEVDEEVLVEVEVVEKGRSHTGEEGWGGGAG